VLAEREPPVDVRVARDAVARVLIGDAGGAFLERLAVGGRPPVAQVALTVVLASLVVEAVRQLVTDDGADRAVVHRGVTIGIVERRLQDAGGKLMLLLGGL